MKSAERAAQGLPERVLVVEDDPDTRRMLVAVIADEGFEPIPALDGEHALRTAIAIEPSAIVLDLMLPGTNGQEFVDAYRQHKAAESPIVVVSARQDAQIVAKQIGAREVVPKPLDIDEFGARLRATIEARGEVREAREVRG